MVLVLLSAEETQTLQREVAKVEGLQIDAVLLTAVAKSIMQWTGEHLLLVTVEGHGRATPFDDIDLSRTLGTLALDFPLLLDLKKATDLGEALRIVTGEIRQLPNRGISYNTLRYMNKDTTIVAQLEAMPQPEVFFNYLTRGACFRITQPAAPIGAEEPQLAD